MWIHVLKERLWLNIQVNLRLTSLTVQPRQSFPPMHMEKRKTQIIVITTISPLHRGTKEHLSTACWDGVCVGGFCSLMPPNNTPVYSVLGLPLLNTFLTFQRLNSIQKSAKRDPRCLFSLPLGGEGTHNDPLRTTWDLVVVGGGGDDGGGGVAWGRGQSLALSRFYR